MPSPKPVFIIKARGEKEPFSFQKVFQSAKRAGAPDDLAQNIAETIQVEIQPGMKTSEIFNRIKVLLHQHHPGSAIKFSLKEGMRKLGPSGFPFEKYIQAILTRNNFCVEEAQTVSGRCTHHEIDFLAYAGDTSEVAEEAPQNTCNDFPFSNQNILYVGECKYHGKPGTRVDLNIALAHYALFLDIKESLRRPPAKWRKKAAEMEAKPILVTNAKFTSQAIEYATCVGIDLWGWRYPPGKGLESLVDQQKLYPITVLPTVSRSLAETLLNKKIVLVKDILKTDPKKLALKAEIPHQTLTQIIEEAKLLE